MRINRLRRVCRISGSRCRGMMLKNHDLCHEFYLICNYIMFGFMIGILSLQHLLSLCQASSVIFSLFFQLSPRWPSQPAMRPLNLHQAVRRARWGGWRSFSVERMGTCAELGCGPNALSGHSKSGDVLGLTNEKKTLMGDIKPPISIPGDDFATNLQSAEHMLLV